MRGAALAAIPGVALLDGATLRQRRAALGLTQAALADQLGVAPNTLARWEQGDKPIGRPERIARLLDRLTTAPTPDGTGSDGRTGTTTVDDGLELTTFIGRERELASVARLMSSHRLVTLTGPGGVGKTRLAIRVAAHVAPGFADGTLFVPLAAVTDPQLVSISIARRLGIPETSASEPLERIQHSLRDKNLLLVLDNFEHLIAAAEQFPKMLVACPRVRILATSRSALHISGEG